ncbi:MAG: hypothetical protein M1573_00215 [Candidatus Parvarchaeota archaeon]|jgi:hypothetical protein|nr:hypothetical protein [Candidatus Parvarchaeota archaeon]MCL5017656.1 hypothetical protein [Candidatus Parvarchaeota archaeon]
MIINYLIDKIEATRDDNIPPETQVGISNNITVTDVEQDQKFKILKFKFKFDAVFTGNDTELGKIVIQGFVVYTGGDLDKIYKTWEESKKIDPSVAEEILQASLNVSILEAMSIAKMIQLPSILPLPKVSTNAPSETGEEEQPHKKGSKK